MNSDIKIYVAGHNGMVGSAIVRNLRDRGFCHFVTRSKAQLDLTQQQAVADFFAAEKPQLVFLAAAKVGGIHANNEYPAEFVYSNMMVECNVIHQAYVHGVQDLLFLGSSCIYPREVEQPMRESALNTGTLEPTNEPYAVAKIAGIKICESYNRQYGTNYRSVMPTNLYGDNDNFHSDNSHVVPALMRRFHEAKLAGDNTVVVWGSGKPMREFMHVDDMADASVHVMMLPRERYDDQTEPMLSHVNIGTGVDCTIRDLAETMAEVVGYKGDIRFDATKPDGAPRKLLDVSKLARLGWEYTISLRAGLDSTYQWFLEHAGEVRS